MKKLIKAINRLAIAIEDISVAIINNNSIFDGISIKRNY